MTDVTGHCPHCNYPTTEKVVDKDTLVCDKCNAPFEMYSDGRTMVSALFEVVGQVGYTTAGRCSYSYGYPEMRTRYRE